MRSTIVILLLVGAFPGGGSGQTDWPVYGHDPGGMRYSPITQISPRNVGRLQRAWTFHTGGVGSEATPLVVNHVMYLTASTGVFALEPETGKPIWKYEMRGASRRGLAYWPGDAQAHARVFTGAGDGKMIGIDVITGRPAPGFGDEGIVNLKQGVLGDLPNARLSIFSPPAIYNDLVITGSNNNEPAPSLGAYGDVRAWNVRTGKLIWTFHTVPRPGEPGHETWSGDSWKNRSGTNAWGLITVDVERGMVFVPIGCPTSDFYGADRPGDGLYGNALVALDANSGRVKWYHQLVHHDLWDYDLAAPPAVIQIAPNGKKTRAVAQITKMGLLFLFDEITGEPIFGMEERPVPQSRVPGEATSKTQPFPLKPPPLARIDFRKDDLYNRTPEQAVFCQELWEKNQMFTEGAYTPLETEGNALTFPSTIGGGNWNGVSFDPKLRYVFTNVMNLGQWGHMEKAQDSKTSEITYNRTAAFGGSHARFWNPSSHIPCQNPPFGELVAVNANTGEIAWKVPLGTVEELEAKGVKNTGALNLGGSIATASGLLFIGATNDSRIRGFDSRTGKALWTAKLEASAYDVPITYQGRNGKQYIAVVAGGGSYWASPAGDSVIAFSLP